MTASTAALRTVRDIVLWAEREFEAAGLSFGHGTQDAREDAVMLVFHAAGLAWNCPEAELDKPLPEPIRAEALRLVQQRLATRRPAAYVIGEMRFAGLPFHCDERVLVPRSPIAELIEARYAPWIDPARVRRILEIGTGSGCIAIASAVYLPQARVDATDISLPALEVARRNVARHGVGDRVRLIHADLFPPTPDRYDVIVSNPPYVPSAAVAELPDEYRAEPALGLDGGVDGLDPARRLLAGAARRLTPGGILVVEVGGEQPALEAAFPRLPFVWLEFERGGDGVFVLTREELETSM